MSKVQWSWMADDGSWHSYDDAFKVKLEAAHKKGAKKLDVDKERYIDLSMSNAEVVTNFTNLKDKDKKLLIGIQRRKDDPSKRRAVKREEIKTLDFFNDTVFTHLALVEGKKLKKKEQELVENIKTYGGTIDSVLSRKIDFMLIPAADVKFPPPKDAEAAENLGISLVSEDYIAKCVVASKQIDHEPFEIKLPTKPIATAAGDILEGGPPTLSSSSSTTTTTTSTTDKRKADDSPPTTTKKSKSDFTSSLQIGSEWMGVCTYPVDDDHFPFKLIIASIVGAEVQGFIEWPTLGNAKTKFKGNVSGNNFDFQEYEAVQGEDEVQLPMDYKAKITGDNAMAGEVGDTASKATFKLKKTLSGTAPKVTTGGFHDLSIGKDYKGRSYSKLSFTLKVEHRKDDEFGGQIEWDAGKLVTSFTGKIAGTGEVTIEETKIIKSEDEYKLKSFKMTYDKSSQSLRSTDPDGNSIDLKLATK